MVRLTSLLLLLLAALPLSATEITRATVVAEMNACRLAAGLPPLREDPRLTMAAEDRMRDMEELAYWSHVPPDGRNAFEVVRQNGYFFNYAAENLATGFETPSVLVESWMESKGHRENIMSPLYKDCGIAIIDGSTLGRAAGKSIVVLFAREMPADPGVKPLERLDRYRVTTSASPQ